MACRRRLVGRRCAASIKRQRADDPVLPRAFCIAAIDCLLVHKFCFRHGPRTTQSCPEHSPIKG